MRIALAGITVGHDKAQNLERIAEHTAQAAAQGAHLVAFPEAAMYNFPSPGKPIAPHAEALDGPFVTALRELAQRHGVALAAGMFEAIAGEERVYNTLAIVPAGGARVITYRKIHLYDAFGYRESERIAPGDGDLALLDIGGVRVAFATCYDLRFPELIRRLAYLGAEAVVLPAAWFAGPLKELHLETLARARAVENTLYFCVVDQTGGPVVGNSAIYDPMGVQIAASGEAEGLIVGDVSLERIASVRTKSTGLVNRRLDLYARWAEEAAAALAR